MGDYPDGEVPPELKARFAVVLATELGWAALESFIMRLADVDEKEQELVREYARAITSALVPDLPQSNNE
jgi:uncharacterized protein YifN (PemK superfamily)